MDVLTLVLTTHSFALCMKIVCCSARIRCTMYVFALHLLMEAGRVVPMPLVPLPFARVEWLICSLRKKRDNSVINFDRFSIWKTSCSSSCRLAIAVGAAAARIYESWMILWQHELTAIVLSGNSISLQNDWKSLRSSASKLNEWRRAQIKWKLDANLFSKHKHSTHRLPALPHEN